MSSTDLEALRAFYVESRQPLFTYALSLTGHREAAEDVIHGVFEKLLRRRSLPTDLRPYVFRSIRNAAIDHRRRTRVDVDSIFDRATPPPRDAMPADLGATDLDSLLQHLSPDERETIVLKIYSGLSFREIAELRGAPLQTAASWYRRGIESLRHVLNPER